MADDNESMSEVEGSEEESEQALLPKSFFAGKELEVGKKCEVRVEGIYDDEVAVSYVPHKKKDKDGKDKDSDDDDDSKSKPRRDSMDGALREMDMMAVAPPPSMGGY